jgi:AGCS family alanine or glycine:cation symporter
MMAWLNIIAIVLLHKKAFVSLKDYETQNAQGLDPQFDPVRLGIKNADYWLESVRMNRLRIRGRRLLVVRKQSAGKLNN